MPGDRQTYRHTDRHTDRQTDRHTDRHTDRQMDTTDHFTPCAFTCGNDTKLSTALMLGRGLGMRLYKK